MEKVVTLIASIASIVIKALCEYLGADEDAVREVMIKQPKIDGMATETILTEIKKHLPLEAALKSAMAKAVKTPLESEAEARINAEDKD